MGLLPHNHRKQLPFGPMLSSQWWSSLLGIITLANELELICLNPGKVFECTQSHQWVAFSSSVLVAGMAVHSLRIVRKRAIVNASQVFTESLPLGCTEWQLENHWLRLHLWEKSFIFLFDKLLWVRFIPWFLMILFCKRTSLCASLPKQ